MILLIDQGNSFLKWCFVSDGNFTEVSTGQSDDLIQSVAQSNVSSSSETTEGIDAVYLSSVRSVDEINFLTDSIKNLGISSISVATTDAEHCGLVNSYAEPSKMGVDRWLVMIALWKKLNSGFIVVDAGSAMTLDIVNNDGRHLGGHIIPGIKLQQQALLSNTSRVKFDDSVKAEIFRLGESTSTAVLNGILTNLSCYISTMTDKYTANEAYPLVITGGDAVLIAESLALSSTIQYEIMPNLTFLGLYHYYNG